MPFLVLLSDKPNSAHIRVAARPEHLKYLEANKAKIMAGGALLKDDGSVGEGGAIILDVDDRAAAESFINNDPFTKAGLFGDITISRWRKAYFDGKNCL